MATVAAIATAVFVLATQLLGFFTVTSATMSMTFVGYNGSPVAQLLGMSTTIPAGFVTGAAVWRVKELRRWSGVPAGVVTMVLMYPMSQLLWFVFVRPFEPLVIDSAAAVSLSAFLRSLPAIPYYTVLFGIGALGTTFWLTLPLGALGGDIHEQARTTNASGQ